ncbi:MAG: response regulator [Magnetococcales bacterium]|nr:response regulator [Magnetococcales bacterium]
MKVLIVDDDLNNRLLLKKFLAAYGPCDMVASGGDALTIFEHALGEGVPYDLVCMDIMMPGMDGLQATQRIREIERQAGVPPASEVTILMVSALDSPQVVMESFHKGGCTDYLVKPITMEKLRNKLRECGFTERK